MVILDGKINEKMIRNKLLKFGTFGSLGMIVSSIYGVLDAIFIGQATGFRGLTIIALVSPILMIFNAFSVMIGAGSASLISKKIGENNLKEAQSIAKTAYELLLVISIILSFLIFLNIKNILTFFLVPNDLLKDVTDYIKVIVFFSPIYIFPFAASYMMRSVGHAKEAMYLNIITAIVTLILLPFLIFDFAFGFGILGSAYAIIIGQLAGVIYLVFFTFKKSSILKFSFFETFNNFSKVNEILKNGFPKFIRAVSSTLFIVVINYVMTKYSSNPSYMISSYGVILKVLHLINAPSFGILYGLQPLVGYNFGQKKYNSIEFLAKTAIKYMFFYLLIGILITDIFIFDIAKLFISEKSESFIYLTGGLFRIVSFFLPLYSVINITSVLHQALCKPSVAFLIITIRPLLFVIFSISFTFVFKTLAIPLSYLLTDFLVFLISSFFLKRIFKDLWYSFKKTC